MRCYLYSTDSTDPALALNETDWLLDPIEGEYDSEFEWDGRGASVPTLGGRVIHDYGMLEADRNIRIAGSDLTEAERDALESKYAAGGEWHFSARGCREASPPCSTHPSMRSAATMPNLRQPVTCNTNTKSF